MSTIEEVFFIVVQWVNTMNWANNMGSVGMVINDPNDVLVASVHRLVKRPYSEVLPEMANSPSLAPSVVYICGQDTTVINSCFVPLCKINIPVLQ